MFLDDSQPPKEIDGGVDAQEGLSHEGEKGERSKNSKEGDDAVPDEPHVEGQQGDVAGQGPDLQGLAMGLGMASSDLIRMQANARELMRLASPLRRTLFGGATAMPHTPLNHSTPQLPPPLERTRSGLSTDGEFCFA